MGLQCGLPTPLKTDQTHQLYAMNITAVTPVILVAAWSRPQTRALNGDAAPMATPSATALIDSVGRYMHVALNFHFGIHLCLDASGKYNV